MMDEEEGNRGATPPLEPLREELLAAGVRAGDTPAAAFSIDMNIKGGCEIFFNQHPPLQMVLHGHQQGVLP